MGNDPETTTQARKPALAQAALCFFGNLALISTGLFVLEVSLHILLFLCLVWTGLHAWLLGHDYLVIREMMSTGISHALPAIYIFLLIGMVIAAFMQSGTVAALIHHGLVLLNPYSFLAAGMLLCSLMSLVTGTAWGTAGTLGIVFIGIGDAMGIPLPLVAGMIIGGATFGDKLSPISDTTNLAAMSAGTTLYRHIGSMLYTTIPAFLLSLVIFLLIGLRFSDNTLPDASINEIQAALADSYRLGLLLTLLPLLVLMMLSIRRVAAEVSMTTSIITAVLVAVFYQGQDLVSVLNGLWSNTPGTTGVDTLDALLGRGGLLSMSWTLLLSLLALALGGILFGSGMLEVLVQGLVSRVQRTVSVVSATIGAGLLGNMAMGEAYISIILNSQLFRRSYEQNGLDNAVLSRSVEEGATMTTGLIPWTTAGVFYAATLGVPVLEYLPWALFNYLNPVISVLMAALGVGLLRRH